MMITAAARLSWTDWGLEPTVTGGLLLLAGIYVLAARRGWFSAHDDTTPWSLRAAARPWLFGLGIATAYIALQSPIDRGGDRYLLSLHMIQHLLLMMVAPPLALLGICGARTLAAEVAPALRRWTTRLTRVWPATVLFNAVLLIWHFPPFYDATLTTEAIHVFEHITFIAVGLVFWWPIIDPLRGPSTHIVSPLEKIAMLGVAGVPPTLLGFVMVMAHRPLYDFYARAERLWGLSPALDQQLAGVIMFGVGNVVYFIAISIIFFRMFGSPEEDEREAAGQRPAPVA
ncbi:MAG: cytochrome c oxidase assembly protein [Candidatus Dormibacteria bacterium]